MSLLPDAQTLQNLSLGKIVRGQRMHTANQEYMWERGAIIMEEVTIVKKALPAKQLKETIVPVNEVRISML